MILTLFYMAATWVQSWRLSSMRRKILTVLGRNGSLVLYKDPEPAELEGGSNASLTGISSVACTNRQEAIVGDLVWFVDNKRCCSVFPQQRIDVCQWISFPSKQSYFPIEVDGSTKVSMCEMDRLHLLVEADYQWASSLRDRSYCQLEQFGVLKAWKAGSFFSVVMESDLDLFSKLGISFMRNRLSIDDGMELVRIQSGCGFRSCVCSQVACAAVLVEGEPCVLLNADSIPVARMSTVDDENIIQEDNVLEVTGLHTSATDALSRTAGQQMSPQQWLSHVELLRSFSEAAERVSSSGVGRGVPTGPSSTTVLAASSEEERSVESFHSVASTPARDDKKAAGICVPSKLPEEQSVSSRESKSSDSFCSLGSASTLSVASHSGENMLRSPGPDVEGAPEGDGQVVETPMITVVPSPGRPIRTRGAVVKPPNVLVFSDNTVVLGDVLSALNCTLKKNEYCVYPLSQTQLQAGLWKDHARLLVVCGCVPEHLVPVLVAHILAGGCLLCLCCDLLATLQPRVSALAAAHDHRTLSCFSYARWKRVSLMHASPSTPDQASRMGEVPSTVEVADGSGACRTLELRVLAVEEARGSPSLLLATDKSSGGKAVFSQVHLETDPGRCEVDKDTLRALQDSDRSRLEILQDVLSSHLGLKCCDLTAPPTTYTPAYFLGRHELKLEFLAGLRGRMQGHCLRLPKLGLQFCEKGLKPSPATCSNLPVLVHACPDHFSTVEYFENLQTKHLGRLLLFSEVMTSTMDVFDGPPLQHGLAVVAVKQLSGAGRGTNTWLSPEGCAMFSLQLHVPGDSFLGRHAPFLQHVVGLAIVSGVCSQPGYQDLDLHVKWPNDIYIGDSIKIGGLIVKSTLQGSQTVCTPGIGVNLCNNSPTSCVNAVIEEHNKLCGTKLAPLSLEKFLALVFTELERLVGLLETDAGVEDVRQLYYQYWLHRNASVTVVTPSGASQEVKIIGIDDFGFLQVQGAKGPPFSVQPDGNSFDMLHGLISPKMK